MSTTTALLLASPARAEVDGVEVKITKLPQKFEPGGKAQLVEAVVSTDNRGDCQKVRWSMQLTTGKVGLDKVDVQRIEDNRAFPLQVRTQGDAAQLTDVQLDPGELCRGRTVTAQYEFEFEEDAPAGDLSFNAQAFDANGTLLAQVTSTSTVDGVEATKSPEPEETDPAPDESEEALPPPPGDSGVGLDPAAATQDSTPSLLGPGLIVGAVLVLLGVGLLMRLRLRSKKNSQPPMHHQYPGYMGM